MRGGCARPRGCFQKKGHRPASPGTPFQHQRGGPPLPALQHRCPEICWDLGSVSRLFGIEAHCVCGQQLLQTAHSLSSSAYAALRACAYAALFMLLFSSLQLAWQSSGWTRARLWGQLMSLQEERLQLQQHAAALARQRHALAARLAHARPTRSAPLSSSSRPQQGTAEGAAVAAEAPAGLEVAAPAAPYLYSPV